MRFDGYGSTYVRISDAAASHRPKITRSAKNNCTSGNRLFTFYEFFAGGGMARAGLGPQWQCLFANDFDPKKSAAYTENWGHGTIRTGDVGKLKPSDLPGVAKLAWASFPCQDLSPAGMGAGLKGDRSGTFWPYWNLIRQLKCENRAPKVVVLENVCGTLTSHNGKDFRAISDALADSGYSFGAVVVDAVEFLPHSRPRLFIVGVDATIEIPASLKLDFPDPHWHTPALMVAYGSLSNNARKKWLWWSLPMPKQRKARFASLVEENPDSVEWHTAQQTERLLGMMSQINLEKVALARSKGRRQVGTIYKRTRFNENGKKVQRAEVRFDDIAGCLRTSTGGSSRQLILVVNGKKVRSRLISSRETARLMGLPDSYKLPANYNEAYHLTGDGVAVPVVRHLAKNLLEPLLKGKK
jgi:DNA (cytosine-5)-methyltransferase 1